MIRVVLSSILVLFLISACVPVAPTPALDSSPAAQSVSPPPQTEAVSAPAALPQALSPSPTAGLAQPFTRTPEPTAAATHTPEPTAVRPTFTPTQEGATAVTIAPIALSPNDQFHLEMKASHYTLLQSASIQDSQGFVFSVYVFLRPDVLQTNPRNAWVLAFYRWDGKGNYLLGVTYPSGYTAQALYPRAYGLANWDDPASPVSVLSYGKDIDLASHRLFGLAGYASDINQNQLPEFALVGEYCPQVCLKPTYALEIFEIAANHRVINLGRGLAGRIELESVSPDPMVLRAYDTYWYDPFIQIRLPMDVTWNGKQFVDVSSDDSRSRLDEIAALQAYLDSQSGWPFTSRQVEQDIWRQLLLYQQIGQRQDGLNAFLANTDPLKWPGTDPSTRCWLALARVHVQTQYKQNAAFTLFSSRDQVFGNKPARTVFKSVKNLVRSMAHPGYDLSACQVFVQPTPTRTPTQVPTETATPGLTTTPTP